MDQFFIETNLSVSNDHTILKVQGLSKTFGTKTAVNGIDLEIKAGEFWGLLGPNGAGKTTTIKLLTGLAKPDHGEIQYFGKPFRRHTKYAKKLIGVVPQQSNLDRDLTAFENLKLHAILHNIPKKQRGDRIDESLEFAGLSDYKHKQVKTFSGGMKRRLVIVRSLMHAPKILFLDEATSHLDARNEKIINHHVKNIGITRVIVAHRQETVAIADRVIDLEKMIIDEMVKSGAVQMPTPTEEPAGA